MNKKAKIAIAAVSVVMAGTMALGMFGCGGGNKNHTTGGTDDTVSAQASGLADIIKDDWKLNARMNNNGAAWDRAYGYWRYLKNAKSDIPAEFTYDSYADNTQLNVAIGYDAATTGAFYSTISGTNTVLPDGTTAVSNDLKPAFKQMERDLKIKFADKYDGSKTNATLKNMKNDQSWGKTVDMCTSDLSAVVESFNNNNDILNLGDYLDKMPNLKGFLEANPVVYLSLLQAGMDTTNGSGKKLLVAPYFDGNDDIERYCMMRQDWVAKLLDNELTEDGAKFNEACAETVSAESFMGKTGAYDVETTNANGSGTFTLTKDYDAALSAAKAESSELGAAYKAIAGAAYEGDSGNIVDIMNAALTANKEATGKQLVALYKAYIKASYKNGNNAAYTKLSDVFNGYNAAWDVDDLVAILRIVKTNAVNLGLAADTVVTGIFPRDNTNSRTPDIIRLVSQLYGERGADSRYEYTYIGKDGKLKDMRANASFYQALENFGGLAKEGLVAAYVNEAGALGSVSAGDLKGDCLTKPGTGFMLYDYSQTQTTQEFDIAATSVVPDYRLGPVNTPVSRWDTDGDDTKESYIRFTESWRSTKTTGLCVAASVANNPDKLAATLRFIDYLFSNDGLITATYGNQSTNGNTDNANGFWYATKANVDVATVAHKEAGQYTINADKASQYFVYKNEVYTGGYLFKGKMGPKITDKVWDAFMENSGPIKSAFNARGNFTGFARKVIGSTMPICPKDQALENQLTAKIAAAEAAKVSVSIANGTIKHPFLTPELTPDGNLWYLVVPTGLPLNSDESDNIGTGDQKELQYLTGSARDGSGFYSLFHYIIFKGYTGTYNQQGCVLDFGA